METVQLESSSSAECARSLSKKQAHSRRDETIKSPARKCRVSITNGSSPGRDGTERRSSSRRIRLSRSRNIVFFFPSFAGSDATAPLGILAVATPLERAAFEICLIDSTITPNYKKRVLEEVRDALCLGISLVTGPMIRE